MSAPRVKDFTPVAVGSFFDISELLMHSKNVSPHCFSNCNGTGLTVGQHKVFSHQMKGKWQISI
jgi:hypothetical protein